MCVATPRRRSRAATPASAGAEAVVGNKSKWRGHCPNHLAAVGFLLAMHTYVMPCSTWSGTGIPSGGGNGARMEGDIGAGRMASGDTILQTVDPCLVAPSLVGLFYDMSSGDKALKMGPNKGKEGTPHSAHSHWWDCRPLQRERKKERKKGGRRSRNEGPGTLFSIRISLSLSVIIAAHALEFSGRP